MRNILLLSALTLIFSLGLSQLSHAFCTFGGNTGDGGNILNCPSPLTVTPINTGSMPATTTDGDEINIPLNGGVSVFGAIAIDTDSGPDVVTTSGNIISDSDSALVTDGGSDTVTVNDGLIMATGDDALQLGNGADMLEVNGGTITSTTGDAVRTGGGADFAVINGGTFTGVTASLNTRGGSDTVRIFGGDFNGPLLTEGGGDNVLLAGGTFNDNVINLAGGNDTINIAADISDLGTINCGGGAANLLIFSMDVPALLVPIVEAEIANANPDMDSITINDNTYAWLNCDTLQSNLNATITLLTLDPLFEVNELETGHTVTVTVTTNGLPVVGAEVDFEVTEGPNAGLNSNTDGRCSNPICATDANGEVSWIYVGTLEAGVGIDTIVATYSAQGVDNLSNAVEKEWIFAAKDVPTLSEWGLIAMASILGIVGFMVIRRRQVAA